jgi:hypothetical protein
MSLPKQNTQEVPMHQSIPQSMDSHPQPRFNPYSSSQTNYQMTYQMRAFHPDQNHTYYERRNPTYHYPILRNPSNVTSTSSMQGHAASNSQTSISNGKTYPRHYFVRSKEHNQPQDANLNSVVTTSFSIEDEREDTATCRTSSTHEYSTHTEDRHVKDESEIAHESEKRESTTNDSSQACSREDLSTRQHYPWYPNDECREKFRSMAVRIPTSPESSVTEVTASPNNTVLPKKVTPDSLKRSFWHHSKPSDFEEDHSIHPDFIPPKRIRVGPERTKQEVIITPRQPRETNFSINDATRCGVPNDKNPYRHSEAANSWYPSSVNHSASFSSYTAPRPLMNHPYHRSHTWSEDFKHHDSYRVSQSQDSHSRIPYSLHPSWRQSETYEWTPRHAWYPIPQHRDDFDHQEKRPIAETREGSWECRDLSYPGPDGYKKHPFYDGRFVNHHDLKECVKQRNQTDFYSKTVNQALKVNVPIKDQILLLAQPEDKISLSETLCTIRENIEVFSATQADTDAPAPGRKHPVVVGQIGLRCIHCRHANKSSDRVKRAVCYPSSIVRIYRTVIDMKLDHFAHCNFVPESLKSRLQELKAINTRSTGTTMQYFVRSAKKMGMVDGPSGVRFAETSSDIENEDPSSQTRRKQKLNELDATDKPPVDTVHIKARSSPMISDNSLADGESLSRNDSEHSDLSTASEWDGSSVVETEQNQVFLGKMTLALPEDRMTLSPLRCFLRENVYAFAATEEDIAVRTPTTFSVVVGQVGIGCIHCYSLPAKERSNRAVCFPFSINRIYQSLADIQRFHLGECKMVPKEVRDKFDELQLASSKGSKGLATRKYWITSAQKIGLVDTSKGIRFTRDPSLPLSKAISLDILAQVASNVTTVDRRLVLPKDKDNIADFLYMVLEQLQACRFTEADRNKRRLKDVGCIGVECKHCAGQVESRKFFWSSANAVESNFVSVHTHMMECKMIPAALKDQLLELKNLRREQTARLKPGSQKAFFHRVWARLHEDSRDEKLEGGNSDVNDNSNHKISIEDTSVNKNNPVAVIKKENDFAPSSDYSEEILMPNANHDSFGPHKCENIEI